MKYLRLQGSISEYNKNIPHDIQWEPITIFVGKEYFIVLFTSYKNMSLIKPIEQNNNSCKNCKTPNFGYHRYEYEKIFDFSEHCENFDANKIIDITNAISKNYTK